LSTDKINRRTLLAGIGTTAVAAPVLAQTKATLTETQVRGAEALAGVSYTTRERAQLLKDYENQLESLRRLRALRLENHVAPADIFDPLLATSNFFAKPSPARAYKKIKPAPLQAKTDTDLAFASVSQLAVEISSLRLTSEKLTTIYLDRAKQLNSTLQCWARLVPDVALAQARAADADMRAGRHRGPLHGLPYALKDIIDTKDIETNWGAEPYRGRIPKKDAFLVEKLHHAGAVLLGKATTGALAYGDIWDGGRTRNPWNVNEGSSGSSAGPASAVASGCAAFGIGTETLGSIISPSTRCGTAGLRPTFGSVARTGAMALCWSLDKIGPICRSVQDTDLVFDALAGSDPGDPATLIRRNRSVVPDTQGPIRLGYNPKWFSEKPANDIDRAALETARKLGFEMVEVNLPDLPYGDLGIIVEAEAAAAFEELTLSGRDDLLKWQDDAAWPNSWRRARFLSAIDYINAQRLRRKVMEEMARVMDIVDALIHPNYAANLLMIGNMTGHPALAIRAGFLQQPTRTLFQDDIKSKKDQKTYRVPQAISLTGRLFDEARLVAIGSALEAALGVAGERPVLSIS
jgi:Asp-tRNA(Asn)/Glu-tRNA(Gln) amidotransferase A subunit family amidase